VEGSFRARSLSFFTYSLRGFLARSCGDILAGAVVSLGENWVGLSDSAPDFAARAPSQAHGNRSAEGGVFCCRWTTLHYRDAVNQKKCPAPPPSIPGIANSGAGRKGCQRRPKRARLRHRGPLARSLAHPSELPGRRGLLAAPPPCHGPIDLAEWHTRPPRRVRKNGQCSIFLQKPEAPAPGSSRRWRFGLVWPVADRIVDSREHGRFRGILSWDDCHGKTSVLQKREKPIPTVTLAADSSRSKMTHDTDSPGWYSVRDA